jgi:hypothetical protein
VPRGSPAAENEKEQTSLPTVKIAGKFPIAARLVADKRRKACVPNGLSKPSLILHERKQEKALEVK